MNNSALKQPSNKKPDHYAHKYQNNLHDSNDRDDYDELNNHNNHVGILSAISNISSQNMGRHTLEHEADFVFNMMEFLTLLA